MEVQLAGETREPPAAGTVQMDGDLHPVMGTRRARNGKRSHFHGWFEGAKRVTWWISRYRTFNIRSTCVLVGAEAEYISCSSLDCNTQKII